jgi:hypothetical protein
MIAFLKVVRPIQISALCALLVFAGCGGSSDDSAADKGDPRPRVEGLWRVVFTYDKTQFYPEERYTWDTLPQCPAGACTFKVKSRPTSNKFQYSFESRTSGKKLQYNFDVGVGDYRFKYHTNDDCVADATEEVLVADGYSTDYVDTLKVIESVVSDEDDVAYATKMTGRETATATVTPDAAAAGCGLGDFGAAILAVRTDLPPGKPAGPDGSPLEEGVSE